MDYKECKFYDIRSEKCVHEDAPTNDSSCIGYDACGSREDDIERTRK